MGYRRIPRQYLLKFETEDMQGFECLTRSVSVDSFVEISVMADDIAGRNSDDIMPVLNALAENIVKWNLEDDDGNPIPVSVEAIRANDIDFAMEILMAWMGAIASVSLPLLPGSNNGRTTQEDITQQLESLSQSLQNLSRQRQSWASATGSIVRRP